jgi:hypothetical protein
VTIGDRRRACRALPGLKVSAMIIVPAGRRSGPRQPGRFGILRGDPHPAETDAGDLGKLMGDV